MTPLLVADAFWNEVSVVSSSILLAIILVRLVRANPAALRSSAQLPLEDASPISPTAAHDPRAKETTHAS